MTRFLIAGFLALGPTAAPAAGQEDPANPRLPGVGSLLDWMGLEPGDTMAFVTGVGDSLCVRVGEPRRESGREWAQLEGLAWPGLATDSQVLVPLDGTLGLGVIRTPSLRPRVTPLLEPAGASIGYLANPAPILTGETALADGWYGVGGSPADPDALYYLWCAACMDAGTKVVLERGRGLRLVEATTIGGAATLMRVGDACRREPIEFQLYVEPAPPRDP